MARHLLGSVVIWDMMTAKFSLAVLFMMFWFCKPMYLPESVCQTKDHVNIFHCKGYRGSSNLYQLILYFNKCPKCSIKFIKWNTEMSGCKTNKNQHKACLAPATCIPLIWVAYQIAQDSILFQSQIKKKRTQWKVLFGPSSQKVKRLPKQELNPI